MKRSFALTSLFALMPVLAVSNVHAQEEIKTQDYSVESVDDVDKENQKVYYSDLDQDGVSDELDQCPNTAPGQPVDATGCNPELIPQQYVQDPNMVVDYIQPAMAPAPAPAPMMEAAMPAPIFTLNNAFFDFDKADIRPDQAALLSENIQSLQQMRPNEKLLITGYTCDLGDAAYNQMLSQQRADAAMRFTLNQYPELKGRVFTMGRGEENPAVPNTNIENRKKNRRVELRILSEQQNVPAEAKRN